MPELIGDFETRSALDLRDRGVWRYATHASTDLWCVSWCVDDGPIELWRPGDPVPGAWHEAAANPDWRFVAFNDAFERLIERHILGPRYDFPQIPIGRRRCLQARALSLALPASLEGVAAALGLTNRKDKAGAALMRRMAKPRKPRPGEDPSGLYWCDDPADVAALGEYAMQDVAVERELYQRIGFLPEDEQRVWELDAAINDRGFGVDAALASAAVQIGRAIGAELDAELAAITAGAITGVSQVGRIEVWLARNGCSVSDVQKGTLKHALRRKGLAPEVRRVLELRLEGAHVGVAKFKTWLGWCGDGARICGSLRYHGAAPGRWASLGVQAHNLPRQEIENLGTAIEHVGSGDLDWVRQAYAEPLVALNSVARALICAAPSHQLLIGDFSGIESRFTAWLAGQQSKLDQWSTFDRTKAPEDEPYHLLGLRCGQPPETARAIGKTADLAFGFQGGVAAWKRLAPDDDSSEDDIRRRQQAWRDAHPRVVRLWYALQDGAIAATRKPGTRVPCGRMAFEHDGTFLRMWLPSGRAISYPFARVKTGDRGDPVVTFMDNAGGKWVECRWGRGMYGGVWLENAVQGIARDLLAAAMLRLEAAGYHTVLHVHDEIVAEVPDEFGSIEEFERLMTTLPPWAEGLPIAAKVREGQRFAELETEPKATSAVAEVALAPLTPARFDDSAIEAAAPSALIEASVAGGSGKNDARADRFEWRDQATNGYASGERPWGRNVREYVYRTARGDPYLKVVRTAAKQFPQWHWNGGGWALGKPAGPKLPYRLPELIAAPPDVPVFIAEGEKDCDTVAALGLVATTNSEGAGKWAPELNQWLRGKQTAYLLEDNDAAGRVHVTKVAAALAPIVPNIRVISFPELPEHGDVSDWIASGGTREQLIERAKAARPPLLPGHVLVRANDVVPRAMDWLWKGHILRGSLELKTGIPGVGKSQIECALIACVTTGKAWPDGTNNPTRHNVIMLTAEDCLDQVLVPRLIGAEAALDRVHVLRAIRKDNKERMFLLAEDIELLTKAIIEVGDVALVSIDPITAYMGGKLDSYRSTDVRAQLGPLVELAERLDVAFSIVTHPSKSASLRAIDHYIGSQAFIAAARIGHLCIEEVVEGENGHRQPSGRFLFANAKNNPHPKMPTIAYRLASASGGADQRTGADISISCVGWEEIVDVTADQAIAAAAPSKEKGPSGPVVFLADILANGPVPATLIEERGTTRGFSLDQLKRAKPRLGIVTFKERKMEGRWFWALPQHTPADGESC